MGYYENMLQYYETTSPEEVLKEIWISLFASISDPKRGEAMWNEFSTYTKKL